MIRWRSEISFADIAPPFSLQTKTPRTVLHQMDKLKHLLYRESADKAKHRIYMLLQITAKEPEIEYKHVQHKPNKTSHYFRHFSVFIYFNLFSS